MSKKDRERKKRQREKLKAENLTSANNPATHPCGCLTPDGSKMMLAEGMDGESLCNLTDGRGWQCDKPFPRSHIRFGDPTPKLYQR
jgi:hypothetical protein